MALILLQLSISFLLLFVVNPFPIVESRTLEPTEHPFTKTLQNLKGVQKGQTLKGVSELRSYLQKFGYLSNDHSNGASTHTLTDHFDENLEYALKYYQTYHRLPVTGLVDAATIEKMSLPRCGVPDVTQHDHKRNGLVMVANYSFFPGSPKWRDSKRVLTYTYKSSADVLSLHAVRQACKSAFQSWSKVTDFTFRETGDDDAEQADIVIGFHRGDHGDGYPFDGRGNVLAHTFAPEDGRLHYDADEQWTTDPTGHHVGLWRNPNLSRSHHRRRKRKKRKNTIDLETVALHEMGHLIGLGHSGNQDSIMYPVYGGVRRDLKQDDIDGIKALYGYK